MLVAASTLLAAAIGIPLGIIAVRPSLARPIVALANLAQTIPSLALFGFLFRCRSSAASARAPPLVALTVYAVLPILRGTITGIQVCPRRSLSALLPWA